MDKQQAVDFVRRNGWLATVPRPIQDELLGRCDLLSVESGHVLYRAGDDAGGLYGVIEGRLEVHLPPHDDGPTLAHIVGPGFWLGDSAAVDGRPRPISLVTGAASLLLRLSRPELARVIDRQPPTWQYLAQLLARNSFKSFEIIAALRRRDTVGRVAAALCNVMDSHFDAPSAVQASQTDLAAMTQLGRSSVNTALRDLEARGLVRRGYASVEVVDLGELQRFVWKT